MSANATQVLAVLIGAREKLSRKGGWTKGASARTPHGHAKVDSMDPGACCWCLVGAIEASAAEGGPFVARFDLNLEALRAACGAENLIPGAAELAEWNDAPERRKHEVIALLDKAIAQVEATHA